MTMETKRDVEEALALFDELSEENQHIALDCFWDIVNGICDCEQEAV